MFQPHPPPARDAKLRLALRVEHLLASRTVPADPLLTAAEQALSRLGRLQRLARQHRYCSSRRWAVATKAVSTRLASELRELQYLLGPAGHAPPTVPPATAATAAAVVYRDLLALDEEFDGLEIADDLSTVSVDTDPVVLEGIALGRFRVVLDVRRLRDGRAYSDAVTAEALDPNPAASNDEVTHPHIQAGCVCFGEGSHLVRTALSEGRLYDAMVITRQVLRTYNDASPYVSLANWSGRRCDECDDLVDEDGLYGCSGCGTSMCSGCERTCPDCDGSYCRGCLKVYGRDLVCPDCLDRREAERAEADETEDEEPIHPLPETIHVQSNT